jgi:hypothetical protein
MMFCSGEARRDDPLERVHRHDAGSGSFSGGRGVLNRKIARHFNLILEGLAHAAIRLTALISPMA